MSRYVINAMVSDCNDFDSGSEQILVTVQSYNKVPKSYLRPSFKVTAAAIHLKSFPLMPNFRDAILLIHPPIPPHWVPAGTHPHKDGYSLCQSGGV